MKIVLWGIASFYRFQKKCARLCLKSIKKIGVDLKEDQPPYQFDYYLGSNDVDDFVPLPYSYAKDLYGYFNGSNSRSLHPQQPLSLTKTLRDFFFNRELDGLVDPNLAVPKNGLAKNGLLKQIIYPQGQTTTYEYEQNRSLINGTEAEVGGVHVARTKFTDGENGHTCANPLIMHYKYVLEDGVTTSLWGVEKPVNVINTQVIYTPSGKNFKVGKGCLLGCCYYVNMYPGSPKETRVPKPERIENRILMIAKGFLSDYIRSMQGPPITTPEAILFNAIMTWANTCSEAESKIEYTELHFSYDLNAASGMPAQFKRVEVIEGDGQNGKLSTFLQVQMTMVSGNLQIYPFPDLSDLHHGPMVYLKKQLCAMQTEMYFVVLKTLMIIAKPKLIILPIIPAIV